MNSMNLVNRHEPTEAFDRDRHTVVIKSKKLTSEELFDPMQDPPTIESSKKNNEAA